MKKIGVSSLEVSEIRMLLYLICITLTTLSVPADNEYQSVAADNGYLADTFPKNCEITKCFQFFSKY